MFDQQVDFDLYEQCQFNGRDEAVRLPVSLPVVFVDAAAGRRDVFVVVEGGLSVEERGPLPSLRPRFGSPLLPDVGRFSSARIE